MSADRLVVLSTPDPLSGDGGALPVRLVDAPQGLAAEHPVVERPFAARALDASGRATEDRVRRPAAGSASAEAHEGATALFERREPAWQL